MITSEQTRLELSRSLKPSKFQRRIKHVKSESSESDPNTVSQKPQPSPSRKRNVRAASGTGKTRARPAQPLSSLEGASGPPIFLMYGPGIACAVSMGRDFRAD